MIWLALGSSPLAPSSLHAARSAHRVDKIITTNSGIKLVATPDVYFLSDSTACQKFNAQARAAHAAGTHCVTLSRHHAAMRQRGVEWFDEFVHNGPPFSQFQLSGLFCIEYACRNGASTVLLCGLDGYNDRSPDGGKTDYWDDTRRESNGNLTAAIIQPMMPNIVGRYPGVEFVHYGSPRFKVEAKNWRVVACES